MNIVSKSIGWLIAPVVLVICTCAAHAQTSKPVVVVSLPSYDKLMADVDLWGQLSGQPGLSQQIEGMVKVFTQGQGLKGLDRSKPWGLALSAEESQMTPVAFLPVTNAKDLLDALAGVIGPCEEDGEALKISPKGSPPLFVREKNGWAFITQANDSPLPGQDPMTLLSGLDSQYDIAVRAYVQNVPVEMRKAGMEKLKGFMEMAAAMQQAHQSEAMTESNRKNMENQMQVLEQMLDNTDQVTMGWNLDTKAKTTHLDLTVTAVPGSQLDKQMSQLKDVRSDFSGFQLPDSAIKFGSAGKYMPEQIEQGIASLEQFKAKAEESAENNHDLSEENRAQVKEILGQLFDVAEQTMKTGKADAGGSVMLAPGKLQAVAAVYVADGPALEAIFKKLVGYAKDDPSLNHAATAKLDLETYKGIHFHQLQIKLPEKADEHARKILGDSLEVYFGAGPQSAYISLGQGSLDILKKAIDASATVPNKSALPMQLTAAMAPIVNFASTISERESDSSKLKVLAAELDKAKGKDHILITAKPISGGATYQIMVEEGVLEACGQMVKSRMEGSHHAAGAQGKGPARPGPKSED